MPLIQDKESGLWVQTFDRCLPGPTRLILLESGQLLQHVAPPGPPIEPWELASERWVFCTSSLTRWQTPWGQRPSPHHCGCTSPASGSVTLSKDLVCACTLSCLSYPTLLTLWTVAYQPPLSMGFSRQEYWGGVPCPSPGDLPHPGIEPGSLALQADSFTVWAIRKGQRFDASVHLKTHFELNRKFIQ